MREDAALSASRVGENWSPPDIDVSRAHSARVYDYWLGGKDNFPVDRALAEQVTAVYPSIRSAAQENRAFLRRAVRYLTTQAGISQFLDIGTGIPTSPNVHEVAQALDPTARVVYTDNDPIVLVHARALLASGPQGRTAYCDADMAKPDQIVTEAIMTLDMDRPVAVLLLMSTQFLGGGDARRAVTTLMDAVPPGSYLVMSAPTADFVPADVAAAITANYQQTGEIFQLRGRTEFAQFFTGLREVEPGITPLAEWNADDEPQPRPTPDKVSAYAAIGYKERTRTDPCHAAVERPVADSLDPSTTASRGSGQDGDSVGSDGEDPTRA